MKALELIKEITTKDRNNHVAIFVPKGVETGRLYNIKRVYFLGEGGPVADREDSFPIIETESEPFV